MSSICWYIKIYISNNWLVENKKLPSINKGNLNFIIIIPVLNEEEIIRETIKYFLDLLNDFSDSKLIIVTTNKELLNNDYQTENTIDILKSINHDRLIKVNYPGVNGKIAHQLNFAINYLLKNNIIDNRLIGVYNADSRPEKETFSWISANFSSDDKVFQQYGNYFNNVDSVLMKNFFTKSILFSSSTWQNRWSIGFEILNNLKQFSFLNNKRYHLLYPMNYCIGHGLFFSKDIFLRVGGFSENTHNEDAIFGLELCYEKECIKPIPYSDYADSPNSLKSLFFQKATWFFGPFQAFTYYNILKKKDKIVDHFRLFILSCKLFLHAVYWIVGPFLLLYLFIYSLITSNFLLFVLTYFIYLVIPNFIAYSLSKNNKKIKTYKVFIYIFIGSFFAYILHGLSAFYSILCSIYSLLTKKKMEKYKTEILRK
jgi:hypothetical protein